MNKWNQRYSIDGYFYGTEPNTFLADHAHLLEGPVLSLAEGEGRNAVFMASRGLDVLGIDNSDVGLVKAQKLADSQGAVHNTHIKQHVFETLPKVDTKTLLLEITQLKDAEKKQLLEDSSIVMAHKLQAILTYHATTGHIDSDLFKKGLDAMVDYKAKLEA